MVFRHISGTRSTQIDVVTIGPHRELVLGRADSAAVRFDSHGDTEVGRYHARISYRPGRTSDFILDDLNSRNGTFVNGYRVNGPVMLDVNDTLRLGAKGPEVTVSWEVVPDTGSER